MKMVSVSHCRIFFFGALLGLLAITGLTACGQGAECEGVSCDRGVCSAGQCQNPGSCSEDSDCLKGHVCNDEGACEPEFSCTDSSCERGECVKGACVSPESCQADDDCVANEYCGDDGSCKSDPCFDKECSAGVCSRETGECVSRDVCTVSSQRKDCVGEQVCYDRNCVTPDVYCEKLDCERGVCDPAQRSCVNASDCSSAEECKQGFYCTDDGNCEQNACADQIQRCSRGTCDPANGECVNPDSCEISDECLPEHLCVENSCVPKEDACREGGCPGNQVCDYNEADLTASCNENPNQPCETAVDCTGQRVCGGFECRAPQGCTEDELEPNNSESEATAFESKAENHQLEASICQGDVDVYTINTKNRKQLRGTLLIELSYAARQLGQGTLGVELIGPDGQQVKSKTVDSQGQLRIQHQIDVASRGVYRARVESTGQTLSKEGIEYALFANLVSKSLRKICADAPTLQDARVKTGDTRSGRSLELGGNCSVESSEATEKVYSFTLDEKSFVSFTLEPTGTADLSMNLRTTCERDQTAILCSNDGNAGGQETIARKLGPGKYFLVVQPSSPDKGGQFELETAIQPSICTRDDNKCVDENTAQVCNFRGTRFEQVKCERGCNPARGLCQRAPGDICYGAVKLSGTTTQKVQLREFENDFAPDLSRCEGPNAFTTNTSGPEGIYRVSVPSKSAFRAKLVAPEGIATVMYLTGSCAYPRNACIANTAKETLEKGTKSIEFLNDSEAAKKLYLFVDSSATFTEAADNRDFETPSLEITTESKICEPSNTRCKDGNVQKCNSLGTDYEASEECSFACSEGQCQPPPNDTCSGAVAVEPGSSVSKPIDAYNNDHDPGFSGCVGSGADGPEAVYKVTTSQPNQIVDATLTAPFDGVLWVSTGCSDPESACIAGSDSGFTGGDEHVQFLAENPGTYYIFADAYSGFGSTTGDFNLDVQVKNRECTSINQPIGCSDSSSGVLEFCNALGQKKEYSCSSGCSETAGVNNSPACEEPTGKRCIDAIPVSAGETVDGSVGGGNNVSLPGGTRVGQCTVPVGHGTGGEETVYVTSVEAGQILEATLHTADSSAKMYLTGQCGEASACKSMGIARGASTQRYYAEKDQNVYIVVDSSSFFASGNYTLSVDTVEGACTPGESSCQGANAIAKCNEDGSEVRATYQCSNGCTDGSCEQDASAVDQCGTALDVGDGGTYRGDFQQLSDAVSMPASGCTGMSGDGPDAVYRVDLKAGEVLTAEARSYASAFPMLYVIGDCSSPSQSCEVGQRSAAGSRSQIAYTAGEGETVYLVVDTPSRRATGAYEVSIQTQQQECTPGQRTCGGNGKTLEHCTAQGIYTRHRCNDGCGAGECSQPDGDSCIDAVPVDKNETITGTWERTNQVNPGIGHVGSCYFDSSSNPNGPETVYRVQLAGGDLLTANLETDNSDAVLYFMEECGTQDSCKAGRPTRGDQTRQYFTARSRSVYVVVDKNGTSASSTEYELDLSVRSGAVCAPNKASCVDIGTVEVCNDSGDGFESQLSCPGQCLNGGCRLDSAKGDTCSSAVDIGDGFWGFGSYTEFDDDIQIEPSSGCVTKTSKGPDAAYRIRVQADKILHVEANSLGGEEPILSVLEDCASPNDSCLAGAEGGKSGKAELFYRTRQTKAVTVVVDSAMGGADEPFTLYVNQMEPECSSGERICAPDGQVLKYCNTTGIFETYRCENSCSNGSCADPTGEVCVDAVRLQNGDSYTGRFSDFSNDLDPGTGSNSCIFSESGQQEGNDAVFAIDLQAGQLLKASLATDASDPGMYILDSCTGPTHNNCRRGRADTNEFRFYAPETKRYYLVVDEESADADEQFTLNVETESGLACQPGAFTCKGQDTIEACNEDGTRVISTATCQHGCADGYCKEPKTPNDTCSEAASITGSMRVVDSFGRFEKDYNPSGDCPVTSASGKDAVYAVDLEAGQALEVRAVTASGEVAPVYLTRDCSKLSSGCLAGDDSTGGAAHTGYLAERAETVYVVVERDSEFDDPTFLVDFRIQNQECTPGTTDCRGPKTRRECASYGLWTEDTCYFGCQSGTCTQPAHDECTGAKTVPRDGKPHSFSAPIERFNDNYDLDDSPSSVCGSQASSGPEAVYKVNAQKGDVISASWNSSGDPVLWVADDCSDLVNSCSVQRQSFSGTQELTFVADESKTYYIVADTDPFFGSPGGLFDLEIKVEPNTCSPGTANCQSGSTLNYCSPLGNSFEQYQCQDGCLQTGGAHCATPTGDICLDAIDASGGGSFDIDMSSLANDYSLPGSSCVGDSTPGNDAILKVDLGSNENLDVNVTPTSNGDPSVYLLDDCQAVADDMKSPCLRGTDSSMSGNDESLNYASQKEQTVFIGVDGDEADATQGTWTVDVSIQERICNPLDFRCKNSNDLEYCNASGTGYKTHTCSDSCSGGTCDNPNGDTGFEAIPVNSSKAVTGTFSDFNGDYDPGSNGCTGFSASGPDGVYAIELQDGERINATITSTASSTEDTSMYLVSNFLDVKNTCVAGADDIGSGESITYQNDTGSTKTFYLVADAFTGSTSGSYKIDITIQ